MIKYIPKIPVLSPAFAVTVPDFVIGTGVPYYQYSVLAPVFYCGSFEYTSLVHLAWWVTIAEGYMELGYVDP